MPYLNHPYENSFKELCASMPLFYLDVYEMREILKVQGRLADELRASTERVISNEFILLADEKTVSLWEGMLHITYDKPMTLDERKAVIMGHICGYAHIGEPEIREIASLYTTSKVSVAFSKGVIYIDVEGVDLGFDISNFLDTLLKRIPAHLALKYSSTFTGYQIQPDIIHVGGGVGVNPVIGIPEGTDRFSAASDALHMGGAFGAETSIGIPEGETCFSAAADTLHTRYTAGLHSSRPVPEDTAQAPATTILRTGGVCTIISNLSRGD